MTDSLASMTTNQAPLEGAANSFSHQAAKLSWVCPIILVALLTFTRRIGAPVIIELVALLLIVAGFLLGFAALFGIRTHGTKRILAPAIVGIMINGLLLFIFVTNFLAARARAQQQRSEAPSQPGIEFSASKSCQS